MASNQLADKIVSQRASQWLRMTMFIVAVTSFILVIYMTYQQAFTGKVDELKYSTERNSEEISAYIKNIVASSLLVSSRTRANFLLAKLQKQMNQTDSAELEKILMSALNSHEDIVAIERYNRNNQLAVKVGKDLHVQQSSELPAKPFVKVVYSQDEHYLMVLSPIYSLDDRHSMIGYDRVIFSLSTIFNRVLNINRHKDYHFVWIYYEGSEWFQLFPKQSAVKLINIEPMLDKAAVEKTTKHLLQEVRANTHYYFHFIAGDEMAFVLKVPQAAIERVILGQLLPVILFFLTWFISAYVIISFLIRKSLRESQDIEHSLKKKLLSKGEEIARLSHQIDKDIKVRSTQVELDNKLRGVTQLDKLVSKLLKFFYQHFDIYLAIFYLNENLTREVKVGGSFGVDLSNSLIDEKNMGLVKECIRQKEVIRITDLDKGYLSVATGLGNAIPHEIILLPLVYQNEVLAVIEICKLTAFKHQEIDSLKEIAKHLAINVNVIVAQDKLKEALKDLKAKQQAIASREQALRESNEELEEQTQALTTSQRDLEVTNKELQALYNIAEQQNEEIKQKSAEILKASEYKSQFLANMSHELRTPLNCLLVMAQGLANNKEKNLTKEQVEECRLIYDSGKELLELINDILDISKVEAGKLTLEPRLTELAHIISQLTAQFSPLADEKSIGFEICCNEQVMEQVFMTDQLRLLQILRNLLSNAIKFTSQGEVKVDIEIDRGTIVFSVSDTGIGISKQNLAYIFDEFQQADTSITRAYGGTGLGLSISNKLAQLMHGYITVTSVEGEGTTFTLWLPFTGVSNDKAEKVSGVEETKASSEERTVSDNQEKDELIFNNVPILLVDSDIRNSFSLSKVLEDEGLVVTIADTPDLAVEKLKVEHGIELVLIDSGVVMKYGIDTIKTIRKASPSKSLPILLLTTPEDELERMSYHDLGVSDELIKPLELNQLFEKILSLLNQSD